MVVAVLSPHQRTRSRRSEARVLLSQRGQTLPQRVLAWPVSRLIPMARCRHIHQLAGLALAHRVLRADRSHILPRLPELRLHAYELYPFFRITNCSASLSRLSSATSFLRRAFSSRSAFTSCASLTSIPPYFCFQA